MIGRGWLVAVMILGVGLAFGERRRSSAAVLVRARLTAYFTVSLILRPFESNRSSPPDHAPPSRHRPSRRSRSLLAASGERARPEHQRELPAAGRVQARPVDRPPGAVRHQQGRLLRHRRDGPDVRDDGLRRRRMQSARTAPDRGRVAYTAHARQHHQGQHGRRHGGASGSRSSRRSSCSSGSRTSSATCRCRRTRSTRSTSSARRSRASRSSPRRRTSPCRSC